MTGVTGSTGGAMQAHLGRAAKFSDGGPRSRAFFLFFRITGPERQAFWLDKIAEMLTGQSSATATATALGEEAANTADQGPRGDASPDQRAFRHWLGALTGERLATPELFADIYAKIAPLLQAASANDRSPTAERVIEILLQDDPADEIAENLRQATDQIGDITDLILRPDLLLPNADGEWPALRHPERFGDLLRLIAEHGGGRTGRGLAFAFMLSLVVRFLQPHRARAALAAFGPSPAEAGRTALKGGLPLVLLYEILREAAPALGDEDLAAFPHVLRDEALQEEHIAAPRKRAHDATPINIAFTHSGLGAMGVNAETLDSFPNVFKEGMAARAERLGDTGPSAPEHWDGALGLKLVHGLINFGFKCGSDDDPTPERLLAALRRDVEDFNNDGGAKGAALRALISPMFGLLGLEILHVEFGEDPYTLVERDGEKVVKPLPHRFEHFGFRDGISQPFVDLSLKTPTPGGGEPAPGRRWDPIAGGEIYLDQPDENGVPHLQPSNATLQQGSTYIVFRKLAQDVAGFRAYLKAQRPNAPEAQERLAAQFVGRWKSGVSLVVAPDEDVGVEDEYALNDFLYRADDPDGRRCPLGSHARRSNPRDIGEPGVVARHRILRRGVSYGGALLGRDTNGDGTERGLLFVAANARIDNQFEVIQGDWINQGSFLGQAGLGRCPLIGDNDGGPRDRFVEANAAAPVTGIPRFVLTRGGDYFFAPGSAPLKAMAAGAVFAPESEDVGVGRLSKGMGAAKTPDLFDEDRVRGIAGRILAGKARAVRVALPDAPEHLGASDEFHTPEAPHAKCPMVFLARYEDVTRALTTPAEGGAAPLEFSVEHYRKAGQRLSRGHELPIGSEYGGAPAAAAARTRMYTILNAGWRMLDDHEDVATRIDRAMARPLDAAVARAKPVGRVDLIHDLAARAAYAVVDKVFGAPGPDWVTELAAALPFSKQHIGQLHPDWLRAIRREGPEEPGLLTMQIWSILMNIDIVANYYDQAELKALSLQCGSETLTHFDKILAGARLKRPTMPRHLVDCFVALEREMIGAVGASQPDYDSDAYYADIRMILLEICGAAIAIAPMTFGSVMEFVLEHGIDLSLLDQEEDGDASPARRLIYEATRINPNFRFLLRRAARDVELDGENGVEARITKGDWVAALVQAANFDPRGPFSDPRKFSVAPYSPGPERKIDDYLLFGVAGGNRQCWGRERVALPVLEASLAAAHRLGRLRPVAGPVGEKRDLLRVAIGLKAHFPVKRRR